MPKFIMLHDVDEAKTEVRVDADAVQCYRASEKGTALHFYGGNQLIVADTVEDVDGLMDEVSK